MASEDVIIDLRNVCRLCLTEESKMTHLFAEEMGNVPLPLRVMACIPIEITGTDDLPSQICNTCLYQVDNWYRFKDLCENADSLLRRIASNDIVSNKEIVQIQQANMELKKRFSGLSSFPLDPVGPIALQTDTSFIDESKTQKPNVSQAVKRYKDTSLGLEIVQCTLCPRYFNKNTLKTHQLRDHSEPNQVLVKCEECKDIFTPTDLIVHKFTQHGSKDKTPAAPTAPLQCHDCDEMFPERYALYWHRQEKHLFRCDECNDSFASAADLATHVSELGEHCAQFECTECHVSFDDKMKLKIHRRRHSKKFQCDVCQKMLSSVHTLSRHKLIKHAGASKKEYMCQICSKAFPYSTSLRYHLRTHGEKLIVCQFCGLKFHFAFNYKRHLELNHGTAEDKVICEHCGVLTYKSKMKDHMARHGEATLQCPLCEKKFRLKEQLQRHKFQFHKENRPHTCPMCSKGFIKAENLVAHFSKKHQGSFHPAVVAAADDFSQANFDL